MSRDHQKESATENGQRPQEGIRDAGFGDGRLFEERGNLPVKGTEPTGWRVRLAFLLMFILLAGVIVTTGWLYYRNYEKQFRAGIELQLSTIADLKARDLAQYRKERLEDGNLFSQNAPFAALVRRFLEKPEDADAQRQIQIWLGKCQQYDQVLLLDAQGATRLSLPAGLPPVPPSVARGLSDVLRSGRVMFQDFYRSEQDQRIHLGVLAPIFDEQNSHQSLGVLFLRMDPETYLYPFIERWPAASITAETLLVRREGNEAVFLDELRFQTNTALNLREPLDRVALPAAQAALGREGFMEGVDYRGVAGGGGLARHSGFALVAGRADGHGGSVCADEAATLASDRPDRHLALWRGGLCGAGLEAAERPVLPGKGEDNGGVARERGTIPDDGGLDSPTCLDRRARRLHFLV